MLLYRTIMGSRLYGTNRPDSDYDWLEVYTNMGSKPEQKVTGDLDTLRVSLSTFMTLASEGRHQYLEGMFAPKAEVDVIYDLRRSFYPDTAKTVNLYRRTINKFGDHKSRKKEKAMRTALKLTYDLEDILTKGKFNPVLDKSISDVLPYMTWDEAYNATQDRMSYLSERYGL